MINTSSEQFVEQYVYQVRYSDTCPPLPDRDYAYDGSDYWQKSIDIMGVSVWGNWTMEEYGYPDYRNFGI